MDFDGIKTIKDVPTGDFREAIELKNKEYADGILRYMKTHSDYESWTKEELVRNLINLMATDIGAAQTFLNLIGVKMDLYEVDCQNPECPQAGKCGGECVKKF